MLSDDTLIDVLKFSDRFDIGERFEFVNGELLAGFSTQCSN